MRGVLLSVPIVMKTATFGLPCAILVPVFRRASSSSSSSHSFQQRSRGLVWASRLPAVSSKRMAEHSREKIVLTMVRVLRFASLKQKRTDECGLVLVVADVCVYRSLRPQPTSVIHATIASHKGRKGARSHETEAAKALNTNRRTTKSRK